jgi:site-specific DNA recombinase
MKENAGQGFRNGSRPPIGYRFVAAEQRGAKVKKKLESTRCTLTRCG